MRIKELIELHNRVIHSAGCNINETDIELEDNWVKKYPYSTLNNVCGDCFSTPE